MAIKRNNASEKVERILHAVGYDDDDDDAKSIHFAPKKTFYKSWWDFNTCKNWEFNNVLIFKMQCVCHKGDQNQLQIVLLLSLRCIWISQPLPWARGQWATNLSQPHTQQISDGDAWWRIMNQKMISLCIMHTTIHCLSPFLYCTQCNNNNNNNNNVTETLLVADKEATIPCHFLFLVYLHTMWMLNCVFGSPSKIFFNRIFSKRCK